MAEAPFFSDTRKVVLEGVDPECLRTTLQTEPDLRKFIEEDLGLTYKMGLVYEFQATEEHQGDGRSAIAIIGESHALFHTWPELGCIDGEINSCDKKTSLDPLDGLLLSKYSPLTMKMAKIKLGEFGAMVTENLVYTKLGEGDPDYQSGRYRVKERKIEEFNGSDIVTGKPRRGQIYKDSEFFFPE